MDATVYSIILDCKNPKNLSLFYQKLLNWKSVPNSWYGLASPIGIQIEFQQVEEYLSPIWPAQIGQQGQMIHLDYYVDDLKSSITLAQELGATVAPIQFYEKHQCITLFDPEGHPFCLLQKQF